MRTCYLSSILCTLLFLGSCKTDQKNLSGNSESVESSADKNPTAGKNLYVIAPSGLSLREKSSLKSKKLLTMPYGAEVKQLNSPSSSSFTVEGIEGEMTEILYNGSRGFAFNGYLTTLAPPLKNETIEEYANRVSTASFQSKVTKKSKKTSAVYGMETSINIPAKSWFEAYRITEKLFNLPKSVKPNFNKIYSDTTIVNKSKRERTIKDELTVIVDNEVLLNSLSYTYEIKDYSRQVKVEKRENDFIITEFENSL